MKSVFHLAYHVRDLDAARAFYGGILGCAEGRSTDTWVDFDFFARARWAGNWSCLRAASACGWPRRCRYRCRQRFIDG